MTRPRRRRCTRAAAVAAALLVLGACGQVHPGAAAVVDDTRISMDDVDTLSAAYCRATIAVTESQSQPSVTSEGIDSRREVLTALLRLEVARRAADSLGVQAEPSSYATDEQSLQPLLDSVGEEYADDVSRLLRVFSEATALQTAIGAHQLGTDVSEVDQEQAQQSGQEYITAFGADLDIDIDPRFALGSDGVVIADTGSLSVPVSGEAVSLDSPADSAIRLGQLPVALVCR